MTYDGAGNLTNNGAGVANTFNAAGRLASITSSGDSVSMLYNGLGELARSDTQPSCPCGGCATWQEYFHFAEDGRALGLVQESNNGNRIEWDWVWLDNIPVVQIQESYDNQNNHVGTEITYLHTDQLGAPRVGTSPSQVITWRNYADAFGQALLTGSATVRLRLPGQIDYGIAGIYYNYFRDYDSNTGRYLESDPIGLAGGPNPYSYVRNNPTGLIDRLGLTPDCIIRRLGSRVAVRDIELNQRTRFVNLPRVRDIGGLELSPNLDPRFPRRIPIAPTVGIEWWMAQHRIGLVDVYERTQKFILENIFCTDTFEDECGKQQKTITLDEQRERPLHPIDRLKEKDRIIFELFSWRYPL